MQARILLAEDNAVNQRVALGQLQKLGYRVDVVVDGLAALAALAVTPYQIVLMDCQMPGMDGYEATAEIRRREEGMSRQTVIIAMTAHALVGERERCLAAGMDDYLSKPVRAHALAEILERWNVPSSHSPAVTEPQGPGATLSAVAEDVLDLSVMEGFRELQEIGSPDLIRELIELYISDTRERLAELRTAVSVQDTKAAGRIVHTLKGSSANLGVRTMTALCSTLEAQLSNDSGEAAATLAQLEVEFEQVQQALTGELLMV